MHQGIFTNVFHFPETEYVGPWTDKTVKICRIPGIEYKKREDIQKVLQWHDMILIPFLHITKFCQVKDETWLQIISVCYVSN